MECIKYYNCGMISYFFVPGKSVPVLGKSVAVPDGIDFVAGEGDVALVSLCETRLKMCIETSESE